jgi:hypothetical protein
MLGHRLRTDLHRAGQFRSLLTHALQPVLQCRLLDELPQQRHHPRPRQQVSDCMQIGKAENNREFRCNGQALCEFMVGPTIFGDTCSGTAKYLEAKYSCVQVTTTGQ